MSSSGLTQVSNIKLPFAITKLTVKRQGNAYTFGILGKEKTVNLRIVAAKHPKLEFPNELMEWFRSIAKEMKFYWGNPFAKCAKKEVLFMVNTNKDFAYIMVELNIHVEITEKLDVVPFTAESVGAEYVEVINEFEGKVHRDGVDYKVSIVFNNGIAYMVGRYCQVGVYYFGDVDYGNAGSAYIQCDRESMPVDPGALKNWVKHHYGVDITGFQCADFSIQLEKIFENLNRPKEPCRLINIGPNYQLRIIKSRKWVFAMTEDGEKYAKVTYTPEEFAGNEYTLLGQFLREHLENIEPLLPQLEAILSELI